MKIVTGKLNQKQLEMVENEISSLKTILAHADRNRTTLEQLCNFLSGHNYDGELFDCYVGNILLTISRRGEFPGKFEIVGRTEVYEDGKDYEIATLEDL